MKKMRRLCATLSLLAALALGGGASAVVGGSDDSSHVYVAAVFNDHELCTGSFVSPTVLVTAAHCFQSGSAVQVTFGTVTHPAAVFTTGDPTYDGTVHSDPAWPGLGAGNGLPGFDTHDVAVVTLAASGVTLSRYAILPAANAADSVQSVDIVGYGVQVPTKKSFPEFFGTRKAATSSVLNAGTFGPEFLKLSAGPGACTGDSGGPNLAPGTDVVLAINSFSSGNPNCNGVSYSERLDQPAALSFIQSWL